MNELLIGLLAVGALALGGLAIYNRIEERRFRRQIEDEAMPGEVDPLLDTATDANGGESGFAETAHTFERHDEDHARTEPERREPQLGGERREPLLGAGLSDDDFEESVSEPRVVSPAPPPAEAPAPRAQAPQIAAPCDEALDFCIQIDGNGVHGSVFTDAVTRSRAFPRPIRWWGLPVDAKAWQELHAWRDARYEHVMVAVQLADRNGATSADELTSVLAMVDPVARRNNLSLVADDIAESAAHGRTLDAFCVDVDLLIGVNIVSTTDGAELAQAPLIDRAKAAGLVAARDGSMHLLNAAGEAVFQLVNHEAEAFDANVATLGVTLQFDVPRVADGVAAFDRMLALGAELAEASGGRMVDDNMRPLTDAGMDRIRAQLADIYQRMEANGVPAGSPRALRLFA